MGWSFRRSKKFGPFRLNLSKQGVGVSVGVPGARIAVGADGRVTHTLSVPGTGIRFQQTSRAGAASRVIAPHALAYHPGRPPTVKPVAIGIGCLGSILFWVVFVSAISGKPGASSGSAAGFLPVLMMLGLAFPFVLHFWSSRRAKQQNEAASARYCQGLIDRFGEDIAMQMVRGDPWQGATAEMLLIMFGPPADVATRVHKQMKAETWKYQAIAKNRYAFRIELEQDVCVGWQTA